jgi:histidinol-phosphate aminotransferase
VAFNLGSSARASRAVAELLARGCFVRKPGVSPLDRYVRVTVGTPAERGSFAQLLTEVLAIVPPDSEI